MLVKLEDGKQQPFSLGMVISDTEDEGFIWEYDEDDLIQSRGKSTWWEEKKPNDVSNYFCQWSENMQKPNSKKEKNAKFTMRMTNENEKEIDTDAAALELLPLLLVLFLFLLLPAWPAH